MCVLYCTELSQPVVVAESLLEQWLCHCIFSVKGWPLMTLSGHSVT